MTQIVMHIDVVSLQLIYILIIESVCNNKFECTLK